MTEDLTPQEEPSIADFTNARDEFAAQIGDDVSADSVIEIRGNGFSRMALVMGPTSIEQLFLNEGLTVSHRAELWVDGNKVPWDHVVAGGATITLVGAAIKGG